MEKQQCGCNRRFRNENALKWRGSENIGTAFLGAQRSSVLSRFQQNPCCRQPFSSSHSAAAIQPRKKIISTKVKSLSLKYHCFFSRKYSLKTAVLPVQHKWAPISLVTPLTSHPLILSSPYLLILSRLSTSTLLLFILPFKPDEEQSLVQKFATIAIFMRCLLSSNTIDHAWNNNSPTSTQMIIYNSFFSISNI